MSQPTTRPAGEPGCNRASTSATCPFCSATIPNRRACSAGRSRWSTRWTPRGMTRSIPIRPGASVGLNFEHIIAGHENPYNAFTPGAGRIIFTSSATASRSCWCATPPTARGRSPAAMTYTVTEPHYIDFEFKCQPKDPERFGEHGYAIFFWADYMNDVDRPCPPFSRCRGQGSAEQWISAERFAGAS